MKIKKQYMIDCQRAGMDSRRYRVQRRVRSVEAARLVLKVLMEKMCLNRREFKKGDMPGTKAQRQENGKTS